MKISVKAEVAVLESDPFWFGSNRLKFTRQSKT